MDVTKTYRSPHSISQDEPVSFTLNDGFYWSPNGIDEETQCETLVCWQDGNDYHVKFRYILPEGITTITQVKSLSPFKSSTLL